MKLTRLDFTQHPRPPQRELRQRGVFDPGGRLVGHVADLYTDEDRNVRFVDLAMGGFMGLGKEHHLVPVEAVAEKDHGSVNLKVDQKTLENAPTLGNPHAAPDGTMHVRVSTMRVLEGRFGRVLRFLEEALIPATEMRTGFRGCVAITDRSERAIVTATWWDSKARMEETGRCEHLPEEITSLLAYLVGPPKVEHYQLDVLS